ncbi:MAG: hypothetical protein R3C68_19050 [Myxococcota bacterium]
MILCVFLTCCSVASAPVPTEVSASAQVASVDVSDAEVALAAGDHAKAMDILKRVPQGDAKYPYAQELLISTTMEAEQIAQRWLGDVDRLIKEENYGAALLRCDYMLKNFPLRREVREQFEVRLKQVAQSMQNARATLDTTEQQIRDSLLAGDVLSAVTTLRSMQGMAWDLEPHRALRWERMLTTAEIRQTSRQERRDSSARVTKPRKVSNRRRHSNRTRHGATATDSSGAQVSPEEVRVTRLLESAKEFRRQGLSFKALQAYLQVLEIDVSNGEAQRALKELEGERQKVVRSLLDKANQHFLRQDLTAAAPLFEQVLVLDPENKRAGDGLQMYRNLERIKKERAK